LKKLITAALTCCFVLAAEAQDRYISDALYVPLRKGPTSQHTILHKGLKSGTKLRFLSESDGWSNVQTSSGRLGWVPSRYLQDQPIAALLLEQANSNVEQSKNRYNKLQKKLTKTQNTNQDLQKQLQQLQTSSKKLSAELKQIKSISANAVSLNSSYQQLAKDQQLLQTELDVVQADNDRLKNDNSQKWFVYGALAVGLGVLLTLLIPMFKPKKRYSEWG